MKGSSKKYFICLCGWFIITLTYFAFYYDELLSVVTPLVGGVLVLTGIGLVISGVMIGIKGKSRIPLVTALVVAAITSTGWFTPFGKTMGAHYKLWREKDYYESVVAEVGDGTDKSRYSFPVLVESGPPVRVAFYWGGILDNWHGIVNDPTGEVMKANLLNLKTWENRNDSEYTSVSMLFGGTLIRAQHLGGDWYLCWFT